MSFEDQKNRFSHASSAFSIYNSNYEEALKEDAKRSTGRMLIKLRRRILENPQSRKVLFVFLLKLEKAHSSVIHVIKK